MTMLANIKNGDRPSPYSIGALAMTLLARQLRQGSLDCSQSLHDLRHGISYLSAALVAKLVASMSFPLVGKTSLGACKQTNAALR